jgi:hypothetical protein
MPDLLPSLMQVAQQHLQHDLPGDVAVAEVDAAEGGIALTSEDQLDGVQNVV